MSLSSTDSKQIVGRYLQAISGQAKPAELVARFVSDPALAEHIQQTEAAFPAYELVAQELIAERNLVAMRGTFQGVQRSAFAGIPATGRSVSAALLIMYRIEGGRIAEHWMQLDGPALMAQLELPSAAHA
jgi:predicted ester cyclase